MNIIESNPTISIVNPKVMEWLREGVGLTLEEAADHAGIPAETLTAWEAGVGHPKRSELISLAELYRCGWAAFLVEEPLDNHPGCSSYFEDEGYAVGLQVTLEPPDYVEISIETGVGLISFSVERETFFAEMRGLETVADRLNAEYHR